MTVTAIELHSFVQEFRQLLISKHRSDYNLGAAFTRVREGEMWLSWPRTDRREPGYATFSEWCDREVGVSDTQAYAKSNNYVRLREIQLDENGDTFARCMRLGWSKLWTLLKVARDEHTLVAWLNDIDGHNLSEMQLRARIDEARAHYQTQQAPAETGEVDAETGESIEAPRRGASRPNLAPAPDETPVGVPRDSTAAHSRRRGGNRTTTGYARYEVMFESVEERDSFTEAVELIRRRYGGVGVGRAIAMMALQYVAATPTQVQGGAVVEVENIIRMFETSYGIKVKVVPNEPAPRARKQRGSH